MINYLLAHIASLLWLLIGISLCTFHWLVRRLYSKTKNLAALAVIKGDATENEGLQAMLAAHRTVVRQTWFLVFAIGNSLIGIGGLLTPVPPARSDVAPIAIFLGYFFVIWVAFIQLGLGGLTAHDLWYRARILAVTK